MGESKLSVTRLHIRAKRMVNVIQCKEGSRKGGWQVSKRCCKLPVCGSRKSEAAKRGRQPSSAASLKPASSVARLGGMRGERWRIGIGSSEHPEAICSSLDHMLHGYLCVHFPCASQVPSSQSPGDLMAGDKEHFMAKHRPAEPRDLTAILATSPYSHG